MSFGRIAIFLVGLAAGLVAAVVLLNDTDTYENDTLLEDEDLGTTEVQLSLARQPPA